MMNKVMHWLCIGALLSISGVALANETACYDERSTSILKAMDTLDVANAAQYTKKGKPKVSVLETITSYDITAKERNHFWKNHADWQRHIGQACSSPDVAGLDDARDRIAELEGFLALEKTRCAAQIRLVERELDSQWFDRNTAGLLVGCLRSERAWD